MPGPLEGAILCAQGEGLTISRIASCCTHATTCTDVKVKHTSFWPLGLCVLVYVVSRVILLFSRPQHTWAATTCCFVCHSSSSSGKNFPLSQASDMSPPSLPPSLPRQRERAGPSPLLLPASRLRWYARSEPVDSIKRSEKEFLFAPVFLSYLERCVCVLAASLGRVGKKQALARKKAPHSRLIYVLDIATAEANGFNVLSSYANLQLVAPGSWR